MTKKREREVWIDYLKAYAIILVVVGHIIQYLIYPTHFDDALLFRVIYSFHMPLFYFISGYLTGKTEIGLAWLKRRAVSYLIPFTIWTIINYFFTDRVHLYSLWEYLSLVAIYPDNSYWFLLILFYCDFILFAGSWVMSFLTKEDKIFYNLIVFLVSILFVFFIEKRITNLFGMSLLFKHLPFFFLGNLYCKFFQKIVKWKKITSNKVINVVVAVLFLYFVRFYRRADVPLFTDFLISIVNNVHIVKMISFLYTYLLGILGIWTSIFLVKEMHLLVKCPIYIIGFYTMPIYLIHFFLLKEYFGKLYLDVLISFMFSMIIPIVVKKTISQFKFLNLVLFGEKNK